MNKLAMNKLARQYINSDRFAKEDESSRLWSQGTSKLTHVDSS
jgi:hypothetical protein